MQYRKMGSLDWKVSALGFGCMRLPSKRFPPGPNKNEAIRVIRRGIDLGINYVDTAWMYHLGASEKILGEALLDGYRERVKVATKLPTMMVRSADDFDKFLQKQLQKLQVKTIDVYLFHHLNKSEFAKIQKLKLLEKMEKAKAEGLINHIGFSFHDTLPVFKEIIDFYPWEMCQIQYNYMDTGIQATREGLRYAAEKNIAVVIMEPLKGGFLANPPAAAKSLMESAPIQRSPVEWALQFLWNQPEISTVLSGMGSMQMVEENAAAADRSGINSLSSVEVELLDKIAGIYRQKIAVPCTACKYCMPCPYGVNIPFNFAQINNAAMKEGAISNKVLQLLIRRGYGRLAKTPEELKQKPNDGNASLCRKCNACVPKCPQSIAIPDELEKVHAVLGTGKKIDVMFPHTKNGQ
jgi:predicted aldo/keto reductase-like oxidoreductase